MNDAACYNAETGLETDKKINLIYGLNGTGKSTLSNYLYNPNDPLYSKCNIISNNEEILVYNQKFIRENFYLSDDLKGVFTLSKENAQAIENIKTLDSERVGINGEQTKLTSDKNALIADGSKKRATIEDLVWKIKTEFAGGDRVLEYCLDNLKGKKETLFNFFAALKLTDAKPEKTIKDLKAEIESISGDNARKHDLIPCIETVISQLETNAIFEESIKGNDDSVVAGLIVRLNNSDWVKKGLQYVDIESTAESTCPFCQSKTITNALVAEIKGYFDETYEQKLKSISLIHESYSSLRSRIPAKSTYLANPFISESPEEFEALYESLRLIFELNIQTIEAKKDSPSKIAPLQSSVDSIAIINAYIKSVNDRVSAHNAKIDAIENTRKAIKDSFWEIQRWEYDSALLLYAGEIAEIKAKIKDIDASLAGYDQRISEIEKQISEFQKTTVNLEEAMDNIRDGLLELGIDSFTIVNSGKNQYRIVRNGRKEGAFQTLSEGEKMIISFLYFRELCKGIQNPNEAPKKRVIVIDDPISSLSHIYVFNVGRFIKKSFFENSTYEQVFVLTHSLYFFYELTETNHDKRKDSQCLYRISKNTTGSQILVMKYEEIQSDYQAYWRVINDSQQSPALIANCMRNVVEYFFNFIEKKDFGNVFQKPELQSNRFQSFYRYMNRESHSLGQNIYDMKEFDYDNFKDGLKLLFVQNGYDEHYKIMSKK